MCLVQEFICFVCKARVEQTAGASGGADEAAPVDDSAGDGLWQCSACTYAENHENLLACMICDTMRGVSGARALLSRNRMPDSAAGGITGAHAIRRIKVPEGKRMVMAFAMCFAQPTKRTCDSLRLRTLNEVFPMSHAVGVAEYESNQHGEPRAASPNLGQARPDSVPEGEERTHIAADFRQSRGFATIMDQAPGAFMMLDYFWLEKDYYNNRYGDKWVSSHLETFFKKGLVPNDPNKVAILPVDVPQSGNMLDMLSSSAMPHGKEHRLAASLEPTACLTKKLKALGVSFQFMTRKMAEEHHPLVLATLQCEPELKQIDAGRIHRIQITRCDQDTPFVVFFRQIQPGETHIEAIKRVAGGPVRLAQVASPVASSPRRVEANNKLVDIKPPAVILAPKKEPSPEPVQPDAKASIMASMTPSAAQAGKGAPLSKKAMLMKRMMGGSKTGAGEGGDQGLGLVEIKKEGQHEGDEPDTDESADGSPTYSEGAEEAERRRKNEADVQDIAVPAEF